MYVVNGSSAGVPLSSPPAVGTPPQPHFQVQFCMTARGPAGRAPKAFGRRAACIVPAVPPCEGGQWSCLCFTCLCHSSSRELRLGCIAPPLSRSLSPTSRAICESQRGVFPTGCQGHPGDCDCGACAPAGAFARWTTRSSRPQHLSRQVAGFKFWPWLPLGSPTQEELCISAGLFVAPRWRRHGERA